MNIKGLFSVVLAAAILNMSSMTALAATDTRQHRAEASRSGLGSQSGARFNSLLGAGVISQDTQEKIKAYFEKDIPKEPMRTGRWNTLDSLLEAGIITQAEHDALKYAMENPRSKQETTEKQHSNNPYSRFVIEGIISDDTADAIMKHLLANRRQRVEHTDVFSKMLEEGIITQPEYEEIKTHLLEWQLMACVEAVVANQL